MRRIILPLLAMLLVTVPSIITSAPHRAASVSTPTNWDPSGQAMPVGDLPGWHQIFADNFANDSYPVGSLTGCGHGPCTGAPNLDWGGSSDGTPDTSGHCVYDESHTVSITGGVLNIFAHTDPSGVCMGANIRPLIPSFSYMAYSIRFRGDPVAGFKECMLLWPVDGVHGEIDYPENHLDSTITGTLHTIAGGSPKQLFDSGVASTSWHTATMEWTPTSVTFVLDGTVVKTTSLDVPQTPMTLMVRAASDIAPAVKPPASSQGNLQVDWVTVYSYAPGTTPTTTTTTTTTPQSPSTGGSNGYDLVGSDGGVFNFQGAFHGSLPSIGIHVNDIVGIVGTNADNGYFLVGSDGGVFSFDAPFANSLPGVGVHVNDIVSLVPTSDDRGYFLVARDGGVFSFNAPFLGSLPSIGVHVDDIVGMAVTSDDQGYWLVGADGSVYAFGDAHAYGNGPADTVAIAATHDGGGYWVVGSDGSVTAFGDAGDYGDLPMYGVHVDNIVGIIVSSDGRGYNLVGSDGGIFTFGDAVDDGSLPGFSVHVGDIVGAMLN